VSVVVPVLIMLLLAGVLLVITGPLRRAEREPPPEQDAETATAAADRAGEESIADLEAAREAKYREIRDAELDFRTGKLADEDYRAIDGELRREAIEILDRLERARGEAPEAP
jgi:hypothetical protein